MKFYFVTRCTRLQNIQQIKDSIKNVFADKEHTYIHILLVDATHGMKREDFEGFADEHTHVHFIDWKPDGDVFVTRGIDDVLAKYNDDAYVYMLDDDNILRHNFLDVCEYIDKDYDVIVFRVEHFSHLGDKQIMWKDPVGLIDWSNFIATLSTYHKCKVYHPERRYCDDGMFILYAKRANCRFRFIDKVFGYYNEIR
jgi:hypothetical protein